ncbi:hypothetical protein [Streptomyces sp. NBC_01320]|nr:hypothetical protein OG395_44410 [Streptomyces sp. NBC_01320]
MKRTPVAFRGGDADRVARSGDLAGMYVGTVAAGRIGSRCCAAPRRST